MTSPDERLDALLERLQSQGDVPAVLEGLTTAIEVLDARCKQIEARVALLERKLAGGRS